MLSFVFTGLGQIYNGQIRKGLTLMTATFFMIILTAIGAIMTGLAFLADTIIKARLVSGLLLLIGSILFMAVIGIYNIYDAYNTAKDKQ